MRKNFKRQSCMIFWLNFLTDSDILNIRNGGIKMDWMKVLFNTDHTMSLPAIIGIAVLGIGVSIWLQWYKNTHGSATGSGSATKGGATKSSGRGGSATGSGSATSSGATKNSGAGKKKNAGASVPRRNPTKKKKRR